MAILNCKSCGRIFNYNVGEKVCNECRKKISDDFQKTKSYIRAHGNATIKEVSEECEVTIEQIKHWVRQERLVFAGDSSVGIECMGCGKSINTGKYCADCKNRMLKGFKVEKKSETPDQKERNSRSDETDRIRFR